MKDNYFPRVRLVMVFVVMAPDAVCKAVMGWNITRLWQRA
jgi:hypothetical protein